MRLKPTGRLKTVLKSLLNILILLFIFLIGVNVGNGRININIHHNHSVAGNLPSSLNYSQVNQVYKSLKDNYDGKLTSKQLEDGLKHGLAESTNDPYTEYFTPQEAKKFNSELNNSFSGIGAELGKDKDGNLQIIAPISGTPADQAGLKAQDLIAGINGNSTAGLSVDAAVNKIRGPAGTKVNLQIVRGGTQALNLTITRANITVPSVTTKTLPGNIGYIKISTFADDTAALTKQAADKFKQEGVKAIILDLRDNPGGLLDASVKVSSLWLDPGQKILDEKRGTEVVNTYNASGNDELHGIPTVILINGGSASASEITTGALHDNKDAYVIGEKSYGKGVVQQLINFGDDSQLKVTVAGWFRPNGQTINHHGIVPDKTVKLSDTDAKAGNDTQLQAAQSYLSAP
ncbi:MAG TPA: S41 family peptidase [Candidatus Saccharimonadales bacterium]|nr:S41 family peptidase [Candidatus Saccharimonadales bacterium]